MHWPLVSVATGFLAGSCFLASACRYDGEIEGAVVRIVLALSCCVLGAVVALICDT